MSEDPNELEPTELLSTEACPATSGDRQQIGPYRLLQKLGEGGMGEVWEAEQTEPVRRKVALKLIKLGMDTKQVVARFEAERQALAMMDHPAIAKVYDAGATPQGRPYFVMEHVRGVPLTEHCDRQKLTNRERLDLFMQVCEGVQHAHQKAVIHRDLKPSNVLVSVQDGEAVPKIIDFGVAKATAQRLTDKTLHTQLGTLVGTPAYMSPEQAEMTVQDIDTRTDVYALGVMLYELLVGALPFDAEEYRQGGIEAVVRKIREDEPPKPSTRLSTLGEQSTQSAKRRRTELPALRRELSGDLDWITMKALEKDRTRRYGSPSELAVDIGRFLNDQPVLASPPSASYHARKFVRRHKAGVSAAAAISLLLLMFGVTVAVQTRKIAAERDLLRQARESLESVVKFQAGMLNEADPREMGTGLGNDLRKRVEWVTRARGASPGEVEERLQSYDAAIDGVNLTSTALDIIDRNILGRAADRLGKRFPDEPLIEARLRTTIGETYRKLGRYDRAEPQIRTAFEIRRDVLGDDHRETLRSAHDLAGVYAQQSRYEDAEPLHRETLSTRRRIFGEDDPDTLDSKTTLAELHLILGRYGQAEPLLLEALEGSRTVRGDEHLSTLRAKFNVASLYTEQGRYEEAESLYFETLRALDRRYGPEHEDTLTCQQTLASLISARGRYDEAESLYRDGLSAQKRVLGDDHPDTLASMNSLAYLYRSQERYEEAERLFLEVLAVRERVLGDVHSDTLTSMNNLGSVYWYQERYDEAEALFTKSLSIRKRVLGDEHPDTVMSLENLAEVYRKQRLFDKAEPLYHDVLVVRRRVRGEDHPDTGLSAHNLGCLYRDAGRHEEAVRWFEQAQEIWESSLGTEHPHVADNLVEWAELLRRTGDDSGAARLQKKASAIRAKNP